MQLTKSGTIKVDGCNVMRTDDGKWLVSRCGTVIGYVDMLSEVEGLISRYKQRVRDRLAKVEAEAARRKAERGE